MGNRLILGDCIEKMKGIPDMSIDCIITDLPYGTTQNVWDKIIDMDKMWEQYKRIIKPNGAIVLFSQQPFTSKLVMSNWGMFKYEWIWEKNIATGFLNCNFAPLKAHENILVFSKAGSGFTKNKEKAMIYHPQMGTGRPYTRRQRAGSPNYGKMRNEYSTVNHGSRYPQDVIRFNCERKGLHPTAKPVNLLRYLIRTYSDENDIILDSCAGGCSTAIAAIQEHRRYIMIEKDPHYFEIGKKRIEEELRQPSLF